MYIFRHDAARPRRFIDRKALHPLLALTTETQNRLNQYTDAVRGLDPAVIPLRRWTQVALCELPDGFNRTQDSGVSGIIVPELIIHALISEGKLCPRPRRLAYSGYCPITAIRRPQGHAPQSTVFAELLDDECCRLGLTALHGRFSQLSATLMAASERERFALVCFHALLGGDIDTVLRRSATILSAFIPNYLIQHPALQWLVDKHLFFAFYSTWLD